MRLILTRNQYRPDGVFSTLTDEAGNKIASTLEHSYESADGKWLPKLTQGTYLCIRGLHRLHNMKDKFETFEITGVVGHTNILFHVGNFDADSDGCILIGENIADTKPQMIVNSKVAFKHLMELQDGLQQFQLTVL